jgi:hypothetical protein
MYEGCQDNRLQELIDWEAIMPMSRYAGGHDEQMQGLFKGAEVIVHWNEGDYQGKVATAVKLSDGRIAIYNDYYGSCSGCDSWEDARDDDVRSMCIGLANDAHLFSTPDTAITWLENATGAEFYDWDGARGPLIAGLREFVASVS